MAKNLVNFKGLRKGCFFQDITFLPFSSQHLYMKLDTYTYRVIATGEIVNMKGCIDYDDGFGKFFEVEVEFKVKK